MREGSALLQGIVTCGHCGRRLMTHYRGRNSTPGYHCAGNDLVNGRGVYCLNVSGLAIEQAVASAFLEAITPAAIEAVRLSVEQLESNHDAALSQGCLEVERARYEAERAERRYRSVDEIGWWHEGWRANGRSVCATSPPLKRNSGAASNSGLQHSTLSSSGVFRGSGPILVKSGSRPPPPTAIARSFCAPCWKK